MQRMALLGQQAMSGDEAAATGRLLGLTEEELIHEKMGDGIMSAIDFEMYVDKVPDPKGDRVKVTMHGKFLSYRKW